MYNQSLSRKFAVKFPGISIYSKVPTEIIRFTELAMFCTVEIETLWNISKILKCNVLHSYEILTFKIVVIQMLHASIMLCKNSLGTIII